MNETPSTTAPSPFAVYEAACAAPEQMTSQLWTELAVVLEISAAQRTGDSHVALNDRAIDCRMRAEMLSMATPAPQVIRETYAVKGPRATSLHSGFVHEADAVACAARLTRWCGREHVVVPVSTAPVSRKSGSVSAKLLNAAVAS